MAIKFKRIHYTLQKIILLGVLLIVSSVSSLPTVRAGDVNTEMIDWVDYLDPRYGYSLKISPQWYLYPSNPTAAISLATICNYPIQDSSGKDVQRPVDGICVQIGMGKLKAGQTFDGWVEERVMSETDPAYVGATGIRSSAISRVTLGDLAGSAFILNSDFAINSALEINIPADKYIISIGINPYDSPKLEDAILMLSTLSLTEINSDLRIPISPYDVSDRVLSSTQWINGSRSIPDEVDNLIATLENTMLEVAGGGIEVTSCSGSGSFDWGEAPTSPLELWMPFRDGETWRVGGDGSFYGNWAHGNCWNDYYATDWNRTNDFQADVLPVADGEITSYVSPCASTGLGCSVTVTHASGIRTVYGHLDSVIKTSGSVYHWEVIGKVGQSGTTSPHLHLSFRKYDTNGYYSRCNSGVNNGKCPNGENPVWPQSPRPSPINTQNGSQALVDGNYYTSNNKNSSPPTCDATSIPSGYSKCADEGGRCNFSGTKSVYYGANNCFEIRSFTDGVDCNNANFGDPAPGVQKACYVENTPPPCNPNADQVALYVDTNYSGACVVKGIGNYPNPGSLGIANDSVSSIKVGSNVKLTLCRDDNYASACETFQGDDSDLSNNSIGDNQVSSAKVENRNQPCNPSADEIALFEHPNYSGVCKTLGIGEYANPGAMGFPNDAASSIKVGSNVKAILYEHDSYNGASEEFSGDDSDFGDNTIGHDKVSSVKVQRRGTGQDCGQVSYNGVILYENKICNRDLNGLTKSFSSSTGWIDVVSDPINDKTSSIFVGNGWSVKVYEHPISYGGGSWRCITGSMWDLGIDYYTNGNTGLLIEDTISSIQVYANNSCTSAPYRLTMRSAGVYDGWILESGETSNVGGQRDNGHFLFHLGDNAQDKQYRAFLSFNTSSLPNNAVISRVLLKIKLDSIVGTNPFTTHGRLLADIRRPFFGASASLLISDFQSASNHPAAGMFGISPVNGWYIATLKSTALPYINLDGTTQFRLRFNLDDNDNMRANYVTIISGDNSVASLRPTLVVEYYLP